MQTFMIEELRVSGAGKEDGVVKFTDGLNIIKGRSSTGKTWILKCIYYLFSSDTKPYSSLTGYTDIEGTFNTKRYGKIVIHRKLGENVASVTAANEEVTNGQYGTNYNASGPLYLNDLWVRILGLDETIMVPKSARYARERISWTNISNVFFADEDEIDSSKSLIIKDRDTATVLLSSLYFLLTGDYKKGIDEIPKPEVAKAEKQAVVDYIDERVQALTDQRVDYIKQLEQLDGVDIEKKTQETSEQIQNIKKEISELIEENTSIAKQINSYQRENANCQVLLDRYESLISQYKADLQRLDFIAKGEKAVDELPSNGVCPFCGGELHPEENDDYADAISAEIKRIASEITVIVATEDDVRSEQESTRKSISELQARRFSINKELDDKNKVIQEYSSDLKRYKDYTTLQVGIDFVNSQLETLGKKRVSELKKKKKTELYHPKKEFESLVGTKFDDLLNKIIKACNYRSGGYASWDFNSFDIQMDGIPKSEDEGKGYRSFLNSVVEIMLYEYFNQDKSFIKPGILMIDTPLLGLDENEEAFDGETVKKGLYQYFIDHQGNGQIIIVDNINMVPNINFERLGINVITYYKDDLPGHIYGFMPSWRKDLPKEKRK